MKNLAILIFGIVVLVSMTQCKASTPNETKSAEPVKLTEVSEIASPAGPGSGESNVSTGPDGRVYLTWIESAKGMSTLKFSVLGDNKIWSPALTIAQGEHWFVNSSDFPSMIALPDGTLAAHWLADNAEGSEAYNVHIAFSHDGGKTWGKPIIPHRDRSANEHGFVSLIATGPSDLGVLWLDGRKIKDEVGDMSLIYTTLGADGKIGKEALLDDRVCECCQTSAAVSPDGIIAVYRDRSDKEIRDISITRYTSSGGWSKPEPLSNDNWMIDGCPVNGPAISTNGGNAAVAWFTAPGDDAQVKAVLSKDGGKTFGTPVRIDNGKGVGRVDVNAMSSGGAVVSWMEQTDKGTQVRVRRIQPDGALGDPIIVSANNTVKFAGVPRMTMSANQVVVSWTDGSDPAKVRTATFKLE